MSEFDSIFQNILNSVKFGTVGFSNINTNTEAGKINANTPSMAESANASPFSIQKVDIKISTPSTWKVSPFPDVTTSDLLFPSGLLVSPLNDGNTSMYVTAFSAPNVFSPDEDFLPSKIIVSMKFHSLASLMANAFKGIDL